MTLQQAFSDFFDNRLYEEIQLNMRENYYKELLAKLEKNLTEEQKILLYDVIDEKNKLSFLQAEKAYKLGVHDFFSLICVHV